MDKKNYWLELGRCDDDFCWDIIPLYNELEVEIAEALAHALRACYNTGAWVFDETQSPYDAPIEDRAADKLSAWTDGEYDDDFIEGKTLSELGSEGWCIDEYFQHSDLDDYLRDLRWPEWRHKMNDGRLLYYSINTFKTLESEGYQFYYYMPRGFFNEATIFVIHKEDIESQEEFFTLKDPYTEKIDELTLGEVIGYGFNAGINLIEKPLALQQSAKLLESEGDSKKITPPSSSNKKGGLKV